MTFSGEKYQWKNKVILIVEDEDINYFIIEKLLSSSNVKILWAKNGQKAVDLCLSDEKIDLVLMDLQLPVMNGFDAMKKIKEHKKELPIIVQTAYAMKSHKERGFEAGADEYLTKPYSEETLLKAIDKHMK